METIGSVGSLTIGQRLRAERERLRLGQADLGHAAGVTVVSQRNYESDRRSPTAEYLEAVWRKGVDVFYVLTGERLVGESLPEDQADLVFLYRRASPELREAALRMLGAQGAKQGGSGVRISGGEQGQVVGGDAHQGNVTFNVGGSRKKGRDD